MASLVLAALLALTLPCVPAGFSVERSAGHQPALSDAFLSAFDAVTDSESESADSSAEDVHNGGATAIVVNDVAPSAPTGATQQTHQNLRRATTLCRGPRCEGSTPLHARKNFPVLAASDTGTSSASRQLTAGIGSCAPSMSALDSLSLAVPTSDTSEAKIVFPPDFKFYLLAEGPFNMDDTVSCLYQHLGTSLAKDDMDLHLMPNWSEHLVDIWLFKQLLDHPMRTRDPAEARLHVVGAPLTASYLAATATNGTCGGKEDHALRSQAVKDALEALPEFQKCDGCNFLFAVSSPFFRRILGRSLWKFLRKDKPVLFATADRDYHQTDDKESKGIMPEMWKLINIPYKAHFMTEAAALGGADLAAPRDVSFTFHGKTDRRSGGRDRPQLLKIAELVPHTSVRDTDFKDFSSPADFEAASQETAETYLRSAFCFVPAGDTPTSRRLFDSIAAGCVPIVFADFEDISRNLPFRGTVDWANIAIFAGPLHCVMQGEDSMARWLQGLVSADRAGLIASMRMKGRSEFKSSLAYDTPAVAGNLLREAYRVLTPQ